MDFKILYNYSDLTTKATSSLHYITNYVFHQPSSSFINSQEKEEKTIFDKFFFVVSLFDNNMRYRMERFVLLPFSVGCISESSVEIGHRQQYHKSSSPQPILTPTRSHEEGKEEDEDDEKSLEGENLKSPLGLMALPKFQRLFKNFKNLSQLFVDKDEMEEIGMEIGLPTDVKHVTHIGIDGDAATSILNSTRTNWDYHLNLKSPNHDLLTQFPSNFPFANMATHSPNNTSMATSS